MAKTRTRKFGKDRYTLKWDSATFTTYYSPDSLRGVAEKRRMAKLWAGDYINDNWQSRVTTYRGGKDFRVWAFPK